MDLKRVVVLLSVTFCKTTVASLKQRIFVDLIISNYIKSNHISIYNLEAKWNLLFIYPVKILEETFCLV